MITIETQRIIDEEVKSFCKHFDFKLDSEQCREFRGSLEKIAIIAKEDVPPRYIPQIEYSA